MTSLPSETNLLPAAAAELADAELEAASLEAASLDAEALEAEALSELALAELALAELALAELEEPPEEQPTKASAATTMAIAAKTRYFFAFIFPFPSLLITNCCVPEHALSYDSANCLSIHPQIVICQYGPGGRTGCWEQRRSPRNPSRKTPGWYATAGRCRRIARSSSGHAPG